MRLAVVCRGSRHFLEPILDHWKDKYELVQNPEAADVIFIEWANEQLPLVTQNIKGRKVVCRVLGSEYYQWFWRQADPNQVAMMITENPAYQFDGMPQTFIPEPVDTDYWHPNPDVEPEPDTILMVGSFEYVKGQIEFLRLIHSKLNHGIKKITMVGDFNPEDTHRRINSGKIRYQLEWLANKWQTNLELLDYQPRDKIRELYWSHEFAVSNSLHEGCQTAPQESMACGTLTLVANWMGAEWIYPRASLFVTPVEFWHTMAGFHDSKDDIRQRLRQWAVDYWAFDRVLPQLDAVLEAVAEQRSVA